MSDKDIPHDNYSAGYRAGWQSIYGLGIPIPPTPPLVTLPGFTPFLMGIRQALEDAVDINLNDVS